VISLVDMCLYHKDKRCFHGLRCGIFNRLSGNVEICSWFSGGDFHARHKSGSFHVSGFSKHLRRKVS